ncbi:MAG: hypothetical protein ACOC44_00410 [Promethearchaeia archaeon]
MPKCEICGKELSNPKSESHINSQYHQEALKKLEAKKKQESEPKTKAKKAKKKSEPKTKDKKKETAHSLWDNLKDYVITIGKWAWVICFINGLLYIIWGIFGLSWIGVLEAEAASYGEYSEYILGAQAEISYLMGLYIWYIVAGIITIIFSIFYVKRRFSNKCAEEDWDYLYNDVLLIGNFRIPWMLVFGILFEIFGQWWGGIPILFPAIVLLFFGPKEFQWKKSN